MSELEPCPFCKGEARAANEEYVFCLDCGALLTGADAIIRWNTRAERTCTMSVTADWEYADGEEDWLLLCSNCGKKEWYRMGELPNYCPECGAKAKGDWQS